MATEWFYTTNKQQMGPVSWTELRELAEVGILKPQDLVWAEGMDEWVKAIKQDGLFADGDAVESAPKSKRAAYAEPKPPPGRRTRHKEEEDEDEEEEDERKSKKKNRKREEEKAKSAVGLKIFLILGGVFLVLLLGVSCIGLLVWLSLGGGGQKAGPVRDNYTVFNLQQGQENTRRYNFTEGRRVVITVNNNLNFPPADVDVHVFRGNNPNPAFVDIRIPQQNRNCHLEFVVPATDSYRVQIVNLGPGRANSCIVNVQEN